MLSQLFKAIKNYCLMLTPRDFARKNNLLTAFPVGPTVFVFEDLSTTYSITGEFRIIELSHDESIDVFAQFDRVSAAAWTRVVAVLPVLETEVAVELVALFAFFWVLNDLEADST